MTLPKTNNGRVQLLKMEVEEMRGPLHRQSKIKEGFVAVTSTGNKHKKDKHQCGVDDEASRRVDAMFRDTPRR